MTPVVIRFGGYQKPASVHTRAAVRFGEALAEKLGNRIRFELVGDILALGRKSGDLPRMVESGELSLCYISTVRFTHAVPEFRLLELPFVVPDRGTACRALDAGLGDLLRNRMREATPFRLLGLWDNGFRHLSNKVRPIRAPGDCRGLRIRTQMSQLHAEAFRALGFEPIPADIREFVEEIATDRFQAQDNPLTNIYNFGVHTHHRYITLSGHFFGASALICNAGHYCNWPPEVQAAVDVAAAEATALQRRLAAAEDDAILAKLDPRHNGIIRLGDAERAAFVRAVEPVLAKYRGELGPRLFELLVSGGR
ncbi:MAG TPA: TRAP transporter substrate-binding protein DctP [Burkholderiales bacterium]|nr:TRAP transporter substrate-binding protein DctP [Burkholderiales bacterium]